MADKRSAITDARQSAKKAAKPSAGKRSTSKASKRFTADDLAAMKEYAGERKAAARGDKIDGESDVLTEIAEMAEQDRAMAKRLHALIKASAPQLSPKTWYGMPAYARDGQVVCFFQPAQKFKTRYATLGFSTKPSSTTEICGRTRSP